MKRRFHQYIFRLSNIAAYCSMKLFSFPKTPKICDLQPSQTKRMFRMKKLKYEDDKKDFRIHCALRNKTVPSFLKLALVLNGYGCWKT